MTETTILDEGAVSEIEARKPFYFCNKCGYFGDVGPQHQHATGHPPFECNYNAVRPSSELTIDALCTTVKHLRAERDATVAYSTKLEQNEQIHLDGINRLVANVNDLQSQLEQLRAENERLTRDLADEQKSVGELTRIIFNNHHSKFVLSRAIQLCKDKAAEWLNNPQTRYGSAESFAEHLATELEKL